MSSATMAANGSARSSTAGRFLISKMVPCTGANARITLAWRGQNAVRSMNWMWRLHHQLLHSCPVRSRYAQAHPWRSLQSLNLHTPGAFSSVGSEGTALACGIAAVGCPSRPGESLEPERREEPADC